MDGASKETAFINPKSLINWNIDKHYLIDFGGTVHSYTPSHSEIEFAKLVFSSSLRKRN